MHRIAIIAALGLMSCAATPEQIAGSEARADRALASAIGDRVAGKPVDCVDSSYVQGPQIIDQDTILYREGGRVWRNEVIGGCPFLHGDPVLIVEIQGSRMCRNDRFRVLDRGASIPSGYCRLGSFTPYTRPKS